MSHLYHVTEKGQVTIPARLRRRLGIQTGGLVHFDFTPRGAVVRPATGLLSLAGVGKQGVAKKLLGLSAKQLRRLTEAAIAENTVRRSRRA